MKIKVDSNEFKEALSAVRPVASKPVFGTGVVGLLVSGGMLRVKAFSSMWIETRVKCIGRAADDDMFVAISPSCIDAMCLYCDDDETEIEVTDDLVVIKSGKFNTMPNHSDEDLSPTGIDIDEAEWVEMPDQTREVVRVSLNGCVESVKGDVLYVSDYLFCTDGVRMSSYFPGWDFTGFAPIPKMAIDAIIKIAGKDGELLLARTERLIVLSTGDTYISTPYPDHWEEIPFGEYYKDAENLFTLSGGTGKVSEKLVRELKVCVLQKEKGNSILLWTDERESGLHFKSDKSELGCNEGVVWSDLTAFQARCDAVFLNSLIPTGQMWNMHLVVSKSEIDIAARKEKPIIGKILIETESGARHIVSTQHSTPEEFERLRSEPNVRTE